MKRLAVLLGTLALLALSAVPAFAQYPPEDDEEAIVGDTTPAPGQEVTVSGSGFTPGSTVTVSLDGEVLGNFTVGDDGSFSGAVTIPSDAPCGENTLDFVSSAGEANSVSITIKCMQAAGGGEVTVDVGDDGALAVTGSDLTVGAALVVALFAVGGLVLFATRKKAPAEL